MAFTKLEFKKDWTRENDFPTYQDSEQQVRADLQYHPNALRDFINSLLDTLEAKAAAENLGAVNKNGSADSVQNVLNAHDAELERLAGDIRTAVSGGVPSVVQSSTVTFTADSWMMTANAAKSNNAPRSENVSVFL